MKVFNLSCEQGHVFEGWFGSEDDCTRQQEQGLLECPLCGTRSIRRLPSAPRLNLGAGAPQAEPAPATPEAAATVAAMQEAWLKAVQHVMAHTEDVGGRFPEEARRIHYGEVESRPIRGQASAPERQALRDEGIEVVPLPLPKGLQGPLQ